MRRTGVSVPHLLAYLPGEFVFGSPEEGAHGAEDPSDHEDDDHDEDGG